MRNLNINRSALDTIGKLGEIESKANIVDGDIFKYKEHLE
jgi:hypothetical protein